MVKAQDERILVVAAHPDDEILGCGGMIAGFARKGVPVRVIFLAEGVTARYSPDEFDTPKVIEEIARRNKNAFLALDLLGVSKEEVFVSERLCCRLDQIPLIDLVKEIEGHIDDYCPSRVFTHSEGDVNVDHCLAYRATLPAVRPISNSKLKAVYSFEVLSSTEWSPSNLFTPTSFFDITESIDQKITAFSAYEEEMREPPHSRSEEVIRSLARFRGAQAGVAFAEGFQLIRSVNL
jgi:LmbE family N-acetylglucosaminyl deacetylase